MVKGIAFALNLRARLIISIMAKRVLAFTDPTFLFA